MARLGTPQVDAHPATTPVLSCPQEPCHDMKSLPPAPRPRIDLLDAKRGSALQSILLLYAMGTGACRPRRRIRRAGCKE